MTVSTRVIGRRFGLVVFGVVLFLLLVEGTLRLGALFVGRDLVEGPAWSGKWRMLSLGDSNTYGLYLDKTKAYPMVFERLWNARPGDREGEVEVLNLGFPGTNSSKVVKHFRRMLLTFQPDIVTVMVGANDFWTMPETAVDSPALAERLGAFFWRVSRAYRLFYIAIRGLDVRQLDVSNEEWGTFQQGRGKARFGDEEFDLGWTKVPEGGIPGHEPAIELGKNLRTLAAMAAELQTKLVFVTYVADVYFYSVANSVLRDAAKATQTPLIEVAALLKSACPLPVNGPPGVGATCPELFPDQHPTALGHERIAQILLEQLQSEDTFGRK